MIRINMQLITALELSCSNLGNYKQNLCSNNNSSLIEMSNKWKDL